DLNFLDEGGAIRLNLGVAKSGGPELGLLDRDEKSGLTMTITPHGGFILNFDRGDKSRIALVVHPDGISGLQFFDKAETPRFVLGLADGDTPMWGALDAQGKTRVGITVAPDGQAILECCDQSERVRLKLSFSAKGEPSLLVFDKDGKPIQQAGRGATAVLKSGAAHIPKILEAMQNVLELWKMAEPLL